MTHNGDISHQFQALHIGGKDKHAGPGVAVLLLRVGDGHDNAEIGSVGCGGKPLMAVEDPFVTLKLCLRAHPNRVGTGMLRFRHQKSASNFTCGEGFEESLLLLRASEGVEKLHVAHIGGGEVEGHMSEEILSQHF